VQAQRFELADKQGHGEEAKEGGPEEWVVRRTLYFPAVCRCRIIEAQSVLAGESKP
jgi:hypothetical protein